VQEIEIMRERALDEHAQFSPISTGLINRDEEDKILNLALLTREHVLLIGPPGTGKSLQADLFFSQLEGRYFKTVLSKFTGEETVFGPLNIKALKEGRYEFVYHNTLLTANYAFIDEIFDANDALLRTLLPILNERMFVRGNFKISCPLQTAVATANYTRINEVTDAVVDRFLFQWNVRQLEENELIQLFDWQIPTYNKTISLNVIEVARRHISQISFSRRVKEQFVKLCLQFNFTTRRVFKAIKVLKANAYLSERRTVTTEDLVTLKYLLVANTEEERKECITSLLESTVIAQQETEQLELLDRISQEWESIYGDDDSLEHLKLEKKVIEKLRVIEPVTEHVAKIKQSKLRGYQEHYERNKKYYIRRLGLD